MRARFIKLITFLLFAFPSHAHAALPAVTGLTLEENLFSWDAQEGATGYNIYQSFSYYETVTEGTSFLLTEPGNYTVVSFNDEGEFSVFPPPANGDATTFVFYDGTVPASVSFNLYRGNLFVSSTCTDVGPGEFCAARCPQEYEDNNGQLLFLISATGGACSTSDIVEADAFIQPLSYKCTLPTFSGEVVAQVVCAYRR